MHHAAPAHLQPALVPATLAARARADAARHVELEARLREWKVARPNAHLAVLAVEGLDHVQQRALHVPDGEGLVDRQPFDLAEVRQASRFWRVAAIAAAGRDDEDRRL